MKILITGANGFIGKNLVAELENIRQEKTKKYPLDSHFTLFPYTRETEPNLLEDYIKDCDFVFHLAGINRPETEEEFQTGNRDFTAFLLEKLKFHKNKATVLFTSSIQASLDNPYGNSKRAAEELLLAHGRDTGAKVLIYQLPNVFGKWCRPHYNSVIATFCHNIVNQQEIVVNDTETILQLVYIDDVVREFISALWNQEHTEGAFSYIPTVHKVRLGEVAHLLSSFRESRMTLEIPNLGDGFVKALYSTYLSYLPKDGFSYPLKMNVDERGSFTEILRTKERGQVSVNISKPHITKGNHWHHTKNEKFIVVSGKGLIQFRKIGTEEVINYHVTGEKIEVVDIPIGYTHNIINEGETDLITVMWCNECFDPENPDTFFEEV